MAVLSEKEITRRGFITKVGKGIVGASVGGAIYLAISKTESY